MLNKRSKIKVSETEHNALYANECDAVRMEIKYRLRENSSGRCLNPGCDAVIDNFWVFVSKKRMIRCRKCLQYFSSWSSSPFMNTKISRTMLYQIAFKMMSNRNGISCEEVRRTFGITWVTARKVMNAIRMVMAKCIGFEDVHNSVIEVDESFIKIKNGFRKADYRYLKSHGRGSVKQTQIFAMVERGANGKVLLLKVPSAAGKHLIPVIEKNISRTNKIKTDSFKSYDSLTSRGYDHEKVDHTKEFVNGSASTNSCEGVFSLLKRNISGTQHSITNSGLDLLLVEASFRLTFKNEYDYGFHVFMSALSQLSEHYSNFQKPYNYDDRN